ncbi:hypothetical protein JDV02_010160 [Purpureocillium takamizusanense]|uniref:Uncharacterized protein n=1 Tax=Purpureocillium takamizusanense TaxID=2060973 RepID=A0A9Q8QRN0_9HYPO|nr:uncharacterized protein JDV02_010160 [Purpureocillium takamizusanense]UNI24413.1 hypothetical protein JDV02_010160 [Purpureocillium takamizusanense]
MALVIEAAKFLRMRVYHCGVSKSCASDNLRQTIETAHTDLGLYRARSQTTVPCMGSHETQEQEFLRPHHGALWLVVVVAANGRTAAGRLTHADGLSWLEGTQ